MFSDLFAEPDLGIKTYIENSQKRWKKKTLKISYQLLCKRLGIQKIKYCFPSEMQ